MTLSPKVEAASGVGRWRDVRARRSVRALPLRGSRGLFVKQLFLQGLELRVRLDREHFLAVPRVLDVKHPRAARARARKRSAPLARAAPLRGG